MFLKAFNDTSPNNIRPDVDDVILLLFLSNGTRDTLKDQKRLLNECLEMKKKNVTVVGLTGDTAGKNKSLQLRVKRWPSPDRVFEMKLDMLEKVLNETVNATCASFGKFF